MSKLSFAVAGALALCLGVNETRADQLPLFQSEPSQYVPGTPFTFKVVVPQLTGLTGFNVEVDIFPANPSVSLTASASAPSSGFVFSSTSGFTSTSSPFPGETILNFSDTTSPPGASVGATNNVLATITVSPAANLTGDLNVVFGGNTSVTYSVENLPVTQGPGFTVTQGPATTSPVPTPAAWTSVAIGAFVLLGRKHLLRKSQKQVA